MKKANNNSGRNNIQSTRSSNNGSSNSGRSWSLGLYILQGHAGFTSSTAAHSWAFLNQDLLSLVFEPHKNHHAVCSAP